MEAGSVSHGGGDCHYRAFHQACYHRAQRSFHSGHCHNAAGLVQTLPLGQEPVDSGNSHIKYTVYPASEIFSCLGCFLCHRYIRRASCAHCHIPLALLSRLLHLKYPGYGIIHHLRHRCSHQLSLLLRSPGSQNLPVPLIKFLIYFQQIRIRLSLAEYSFPKTGSQLPVMVQLGISQILIRQVLKLLLCFFYVNTAGLYLLQ